MALQISQIFYTIVLRVEIATIFQPKVVAISAHNTIMRKFANFVRLYFPQLQHFSTKFWDFTTFKRFFPEISSLLSRSKLKLIYNGNCPLESRILELTIIQL